MKYALAFLMCCISGAVIASAGVVAEIGPLQGMRAVLGATFAAICFMAGAIAAFVIAYKVGYL